MDRVTLMLAFVFVLTNTARLHDAPAHCQAAVDEAKRVGDDGLLAEALVVRAMIGFLVGNGVAESDLVHALALEDPERPTPIMLTPSAIAGRIWGWTGRFEESRELIDEVRQRSRERGAETDLVYLSPSMATTPCEAGALDLVRGVVDDAIERAAQLGTPAARAVALSVESTLAGWTGDAERAAPARARVRGRIPVDRGAGGGVLAAAGARTAGAVRRIVPRRSSRRSARCLSSS